LFSAVVKTAGKETQSAAVAGIEIDPAGDRSGGRIRLRIRPGATVVADAYDAAGRRIRNLARQRYDLDRIELEWDFRNDRGESVPPGIYLIRVRAGETQVDRRLAVVR
jgi:hypothetical protein